MKPEWSWMWASSQKKPSTGWKMFPVRAGRSHFSWSNFQMQDTEDEMSASVCLSVYFFSMCISLLYHVCSQTRSLSKSRMKEAKSWGGHHDWCTFTCYLDDFRDFVSFSSEKKSCKESCMLLYISCLYLSINVLRLRIKTDAFLLYKRNWKRISPIFVQPHNAGERWICSCTVSDSDFITYPHRNCLSIKLCSFID